MMQVNHPVCSPAPGLSADFSPVAPSEFHRPEVAIERDPPGTLADDALGGVLPTVPVDAEPEHDSLDPLIRIFATEDDGRIPEHTQSAESAPEYASAIRWVAFPSSEESLASPLLPLAHADDGPTAENTGDPETQEVAFIPSRVVISDAPGISSETPWPSEGLKAPLAKLSSAQRAVAPPSEAITASSAPTVLEAARLPAVAEAPAPGDALVRAPLPAAAPVLDTYIEGINFNENGALAGFWIPPDPSGAAGPNHLVSVVNVSIEWFTKDGVNQQSESLENF